jgi:hypothetical protein
MDARVIIMDRFLTDEVAAEVKGLEMRAGRRFFHAAIQGHVHPLASTPVKSVAFRAALSSLRRIDNQVAAGKLGGACYCVEGTDERREAGASRL